MPYGLDGGIQDCCKPNSAILIITSWKLTFFAQLINTNKQNADYI